MSINNTFGSWEQRYQFDWYPAQSHVPGICGRAGVATGVTERRFLHTEISAHADGACRESCTKSDRSPNHRVSSRPFQCLHQNPEPTPSAFTVGMLCEERIPRSGCRLCRLCRGHGRAGHSVQVLKRALGSCGGEQVR